MWKRMLGSRAGERGIEKQSPAMKRAGKAALRGGRG